MQSQFQTPPPLFKPNAAGFCGHLIHPGTPQTEVLCPTCKVKQRLDELRPMTEIWERRGGPYLHPEKDPGYYQACQAWHMHRASLAKYVYFLEIWSEQEKAWDAEHPNITLLLNPDVQSATKAIQLARKGTPYLQWRDSDAEVESKRPGFSHRRTVSFEEPTVEKVMRRPENFARASTLYQPGVWAPVCGCEYWNTSFQCVEEYGTPEFDEVLDRMWEGS
ncbi:hypothetical protein P280DRAFT_547213 [Massarina eburnea CBS 473.64]|uniref:Uncharacterized protein n=1 Tax=Massarina eburnea CBS 473.64 TaxID=1395130 RepID=A0A6A6S5G6_9PLEO|nr:hypothetical protein P280DRAFT_547213 [Massarina eburnea CBS 473.64]